MQSGASHCKSFWPLLSSDLLFKWLQIIETFACKKEFRKEQSLCKSLLFKCDQMARSFVQYLAIYSNQNLPKRIPNFPKQVKRLGQYFAKYLISTQKWPKVLHLCQRGKISPNLDTLFKHAKMHSHRAFYKLLAISYYGHILRHL